MKSPPRSSPKKKRSGFRIDLDSRCQTAVLYADQLIRELDSTIVGGGGGVSAPLLSSVRERLSLVRELFAGKQTGDAPFAAAAA